ncbi:type I-F CRISPR-associated endoribonuclease Cas6/Csy4 [Photobacterium leiognathi]|uniref:type I-F CRISPR-associated endoribonuclease Cas6/Csy4 n=1 Tax=Photobacterium leiognathi TaxID=553611 RepID=UPI0027396435|nr:type I-F CRISPR-associated endoribonuclease Cas6/Csy4 [Photobacterium leiognathi]
MEKKPSVFTLKRLVQPLRLIDDWWSEDAYKPLRAHEYGADRNYLLARRHPAIANDFYTLIKFVAVYIRSLRKVSSPEQIHPNIHYVMSILCKGGLYQRGKVMVERYYVVIRYLVDDIDLGLVAGRCVNILHGVLLSKKNQYSGIGVSFPKWSNSSLGNEIAFVSYDRHALDYLTQQPYFEMMMNEKIFLISSVNTVPKELPEVSFRRNQNIAKMFYR